MTEQTPDQTTDDMIRPESGLDAPQDATKPVSEWATGDEPATGPQRSYLQTLAREAGEDVPAELTKADASVMIDRLQSKSPRVEG